MAEEIKIIPIEQIVPDPQNLRQTFDADEIAALADNLVEIRQTDPIQLFERGRGIYDLFDGERRWRAATQAGMTHLRAIIIERPSETDILVKKISRVMQTKSLSFPEEIDALEKGLDALGVLDDESKWSGASKRLGIPSGALRERMRVRRLSENLQTRFVEGGT